MGSFYWVWVQDPDIEGRFRTPGVGGSLDWALRVAKNARDRDLEAIVLPFGREPKCDACGELCDEMDGLHRDCKPEPMYVRDVA